jgi:hypothetical protein
MSGFLFSSSDDSWMKASHWFCAVMHRIHTAFPAELAALRDQVFTAYDTLDIVNLKDLDEHQYNVFYCIAENCLHELPFEAKRREEMHRSKFLTHPKKLKRRLAEVETCLTDMTVVWREMLSILRRDTRFREVSNLTSVSNEVSPRP